MLQMHCLPYATVWKIGGLDSGVNSVHRLLSAAAIDRQAVLPISAGDVELGPHAKPGRSSWIEGADKRVREDEL